MQRRLQIRRQVMLLLVAMRISYGGTLLAMLFANANTENTLMWQVLRQGGLSVLPAAVLAVSAFLLLVDGILEFLWPYISSKKTEIACIRSKWLQVKWLHSFRYLLIAACRLANKLRHWFYLPPAFACLFIIPLAVYTGAKGVPVLSLLYLWMFACGLSAALLEGVINNERLRNEK